jgi:hypothetical protein
VPAKAFATAAISTSGDRKGWRDQQQDNSSRNWCLSVEAHARMSRIDWKLAIAFPN